MKQLYALAFACSIVFGDKAVHIQLFSCFHYLLFANGGERFGGPDVMLIQGKLLRDLADL